MGNTPTKSDSKVKYNKDPATHLATVKDKRKANANAVMSGNTSITSMPVVLPTDQLSSAVNSGHIKTENETLSDAELVNPEAIKNFYIRDFLVNPDLKSVKVKMIFSSLGMKQPTTFSKKVKKEVQDKISKALDIAEFGTVHTALLIGPAVIEWNRSNFVEITRTNRFSQGFRSLAVVDLDDIPLQDFKNCVDDICRLIVKWNGEERYDNKFANCQRFTQEVLELLHQEKMSKGLRAFIAQCAHGDPNKPDFSYRFADDKEDVNFTSHAEFDELIRKRLPHLESLEHSSDKKDRNEFRILKAIDRVYWFRFLSALTAEELNDKEDKKKELIGWYQPSHEGCPFHDPRESGTILGGNTETSSFLSVDSFNTFEEDDEEM